MMNATELLVGRRRKVLCQDDMAVYLGISRYKLNRMESGEVPVPPDIALKAHEVFGRFGRDAVHRVAGLMSILARDGYSIQEISAASGLSTKTVKVLRGGAKKPAPDELEALLNIPPRPARRNRAARR